MDSFETLTISSARRPIKKREDLSEDVPLTQSSLGPTNIAQHGRDLSEGVPFDPSNPAHIASLGTFNPPTKKDIASQSDSGMIKQPETRPISQEQLDAEVKGIYTVLVGVEAKCIEVDNRQAAEENTPELNNEQWKAFIALHRTLLHEHCDFFLASQHPSGSLALHRLALKYAMPARMWCHGIHAFLEVLRHRLPASLNHMLAFIHLAYNIVTLLYETVLVFQDTWRECLGDLARYRMAIEYDDIPYRETWTNVARYWYLTRSDKAPTTGRFYHYLALLARPNVLQQLAYFSKSLCVETPFEAARETLVVFFGSSAETLRDSLTSLENEFFEAHDLLFTRNARFDVTTQSLLVLLRAHIGCTTEIFKKQGSYIAVVNSTAMMEFGLKTNVLVRAIAEDKGDTTVATTSSEDISSFRKAERLSNKFLSIALERIGDPNVLPFIHVTMVYVLYLSTYPSAMSWIQDGFPWNLLSAALNKLSKKRRLLLLEEEIAFRKENTPFPEEYFMRGLLWTEDYFPDAWLSNEDGSEEHNELPSMTEQRTERILYIGIEISKRCPRIFYSEEGFSTPIHGLA